MKKVNIFLMILSFITAICCVFGLIGAITAAKTVSIVILSIFAAVYSVVAISQACLMFDLEGEIVEKQPE